MSYTYLLEGGEEYLAESFSDIPASALSNLSLTSDVFVENAATLTVRGLGTVLGDLASMGFNAEWGVLGASDAIWLDGTPAYDHERLRCFIAATNANRLRELQPQGRIQDERRRVSNGIAPPAYTNRFRNMRSPRPETPALDKERNSSPFERVGRGIAMQASAANSGWWANEPGVGRMVHGLANRVDRLEAIGDGQVPRVVTLAWRALNSSTRQTI